jgi:hypothetical protein
MRRTIIRVSLLATCLAMLPMLAACAPTYDNIADQMLADTQKQADDGLLKLQTLAVTINALDQSKDANDQKAVATARTQASYAANLDFYDQLQASITALDTRMTAMSDLSTPGLNTALSALEKNVEGIRSTHSSEKTLGAEYAKESRLILDQQFKSLTVYELTIKAGSKPK